MSYLGLTPSEDSSGDKQSRGPITKAGNRRVRRLLTESSWHYRHRYSPGKTLRKRRRGQPQWAIDIDGYPVRKKRNGIENHINALGLFHLAKKDKPFTFFFDEHTLLRRGFRNPSVVGEPFRAPDGQGSEILDHFLGLE